MAEGIAALALASVGLGARTVIIAVAALFAAAGLITPLARDLPPPR